jgi:hypothetical protein
VTAVAGQFAVGSREREPGLLAVIEIPETPSVWRVALGALRPKAAVVGIVALVAVVAADADVPILSRLVALLARNRHMQAHQWKIRQIVIEGDRRFPTFRGMALFALLTELAGMYVARAMTSGAILWKLLRRDRCDMTSVASHLLMSTGELPVSVAGVIESRGLPLVIAMAMIALGSKTSGVRVLALMAAEAIVGNLVLQVAAAMTTLTVDIRVHALERKTCLFLVVELRRLPACGRMTATAFRTPIASMDVVRGVARDAFLGGSLVAIAEMTAHARNLHMLVA